ncbi:ECF RNA polymerase sigma factor SigL [Phycisphaerae bacterium RAS1]|nr:ECF RNA polymerase sigma factor SigL [Phycisphaerae bacterium RAS1]
MPRSGDDLATMTSTFILEGLRDPDNRAVWGEYVARYRPLLVSYARRLGLAEPDAEDVAQQTLVSFSTAYQDGKYEREKGRLRAWLFAIARNQVVNWRRNQRSREHQVGEPDSGTGYFASQPDDKSMEAIWDEEWRAAVLARCLAQVRSEVQPATYEAFELFAYRGMAAEDVARKLGMTANAVFGAKRRILRRVRELLPDMEEIW